MSNYQRPAALVALAILVIEIVACGSNMNSSRYLQSITVTPATADAQGGQVQFTATGTYNRPPSPVQLTFNMDQSFTFAVDDTNIAAIVSGGADTGTLTAKCMPGASGTTSVSAHAAGHAGGTANTPILLHSSATLTCP